MMNRYIVVVGLLAGCGEVDIAALTVPPPGKVATLDAKNHTLQLSRGVAFAFECTESDGGYYGPCRDAQLASSDATIAQALPTYLDDLSSGYAGEVGPRSRSAFVVIGLAEGPTSLALSTAQETITIAVTVLP
jgi:hypothetical protein